MPRPRRLTLAWPPLPGLFDVLVNAGTNCGSVLSVDSTVFEPLRSKSSSVTETIGLAESKSGRAMREPVTNHLLEFVVLGGGRSAGEAQCGDQRDWSGKAYRRPCRRPADVRIDGF